MSDALPLNTALSRNARCPCGSGKRYKDCHGSLTDRGPNLRIPDELTRRLDAALEAQRAGRLDEAAARYEAVVAEHPDLFDALHMLGVTHYQRGDFERAQDLVLSALRLSPADQPARHNLQLIESVLERRSVELEICRQTLPRLARRCVAAPASSSDDAIWRHAAVDLIASRADAFHRRGIVERLAGWLRPASLTVWLYPGMNKPEAVAWPVRVIDAKAFDIPDRSCAIFVGGDRSPADWYEHATATDVALYCDDESPRTLLDRIPELAREGRTPLRLLFNGAAQAARIGLPGTIVPGVAPQS